MTQSEKRHLCFIQILEDIRLDDKDKRIIINLYNQRQTVNINNKFSKYSHLCCFRCYSSCTPKPNLTNLLKVRRVYLQVKIHEVQKSSTIYSDDTIIITRSNIELQRFIDRLNIIFMEFNMKIKR